MIDMVGNPIQVGDYGAFLSGPAIPYLGKINEINNAYGFMEEHLNASIPWSFSYTMEGKQKDNELISLNFGERRLSKMFTIADFEIIPDLPWPYLEAIVLPSLVERRKAATGYDFCGNTLKDGDYVTFRKGITQHIGRIIGLPSQQVIEVLKFSENKLVYFDRMLMPSPSYLIKLPAIYGYRCSDLEHQHTGCFRELTTPLFSNPL